MSATKSTSRAKKAASKPPELVLQRVVFPEDADFDTLPLYAEAGQAQPGIEAEPSKEPTSETATIEHTLHPDLVIGRRSLRIEAGTRVSFGTYFNAFPASYWRRWTSVESVQLRVSVEGVADILVYRSSSRGDHQRVAKKRVSSGDTAEFELPLAAFGDGGWYWFDIVSGTTEATLTSAEWVTKTFEQADPGRLSLGITTFNRPDYCVDLLNHIAADEGATAVIDSIFVIDQGTQLVEENEGFADVAAKLGDRLVMVKQPNLGGSGGFSRSMYEAAYGEDSRYVLLLDDDVLLETEGMMRAVTFADQCRVPTIVGGHMLNMHVRSMMHAYGETVQRYRFFWGPAPHTYHSHNFATHSLRSTRWLHRRIDVDYNGWWMCLIPDRRCSQARACAAHLHQVGRRRLSDCVLSRLACPQFRFPAPLSGTCRGLTRTTPSTGRPITTLATECWLLCFTRRTSVVDGCCLSRLRCRSSMRFPCSTARPSCACGRSKTFFPDLNTCTALCLPALRRSVRSGRTRMTQPSPTILTASLLPGGSSHRSVARTPRSQGPIKPLRRGGRGLYRQLQPVRPTAQKNPEIRVAAMDLRWRLLGQFDSAVVSTADGAGASWYKRDRTRFGDVMRRSAAVHQKLMVEWDALAEQYREAVPDVVDPKAWINTWSQQSTVIVPDCGRRLEPSKKVRRVYIHVGAPKTGTTFLQGVLWQNREAFGQPVFTWSVTDRVTITAPVMTSARCRTTRQILGQTGRVRGRFCVH